MATDNDILDVESFVDGIKDRMVVEAIKKKLASMSHGEVLKLQRKYCSYAEDMTLAYSIYTEYKDRPKKKRRRG